MKTRVLTLSVLTLLLVLAACSPASEPTPPPSATPAADKAPSAEMISGTWAINISKSTYSPANLAPKSGTTVMQATSDSIHVMTDGVDSKGRKTHTDYTASFSGPGVPTNGTVDGKPNPDADGAVWKKIDDHTFEISNTLKGQTMTTTRIAVAHDGKSRTNTVTGKNAQGQAVSNTVVMEKQ